MWPQSVALNQAFSSTHPFVRTDPLDDDVEAALRWLAARSPEEVQSFREQQITRIEALAAHLVESGACARWLEGADEHVQACPCCCVGARTGLKCFHALSCTGNMCRRQRTVDRVVDGRSEAQRFDLRGALSQGCVGWKSQVACSFPLPGSGSPLFGALEVAGIGEPSFADSSVEAVVDRDACFGHNFSLLSSMAEDEHSEELLKLTREDASKGRMSAPKPGGDAVDAVDVVLVRLCLRVLSQRMPSRRSEAPPPLLGRTRKEVSCIARS